MEIDGKYIALGIAVMILIYGGYVTLNTEGGGDITSTEVSVNRKIEFICIDKFAGTPVTSATLKVYQDNQLFDSLTTDGTTGKITTGNNFESGTVLDVLLTKSNDKAWYTITVPKMSKNDLEALTNNPIKLDFFSLDTSATLKIVDSLGNAYATTDTLNFTTLGVSQISIVVSGYISADNKGYIASYDPLNGIRWDGVCYGKLSGTNYELLSLSGWQSAYPKGLAIWGSKVIPPEQLTKYKVGNTYVNDGVFSFTLTLTKGGYTGDAADIDLYLYAYSDPTYHNTYGSFGPDSVAMATTFKLNLEA